MPAFALSALKPSCASLCASSVRQGHDVYNVMYRRFFVVRKQIYLKERQQEAIRSIASARGISEAEVIREAIDTQGGQQTHHHPLDPVAWKRALKLMRSLQPK